MSDLERSISLYTEMFGFTVTFRSTVTEPCIGEIVSYPSMEIRQVFLSVPGSEHGPEPLKYRNIVRRAVDPTATVRTQRTCACSPMTSGLSIRV